MDKGVKWGFRVSMENSIFYADEAAVKLIYVILPMILVAYIQFMRSHRIQQKLADILVIYFELYIFLINSKTQQHDFFYWTNRFILIWTIISLTKAPSSLFKVLQCAGFGGVHKEKHDLVNCKTIAQIFINISII